MLLRLLRYNALRVEDVMVPRADIIAVDETRASARYCRRSSKPASRACRCFTNRLMIRAA